MKLVLGVFDATPHPMHYRWIDDSWVLSDINPRHPHIKQVDARSLPYTELEAIYASHVVEHIAQKEVLNMFKQWYSCLLPGGWAIINVPDMEWVEANLQSMDQKRLEEIIFGGRDTPHDLHRSWYTKDWLEYLLRQAGFSEITVDQEVEAHEMGCLIAKAFKR